MVAPFAKSAVIPTAGLAPFRYNQDAVDGDPNAMFWRSLWTYNGRLQTVPEVAASFKRVMTAESGLQGGLPPFEPEVVPFGNVLPGQQRRSALATRATVWQNFFPTVADSQEGYNYSDNHFVGIFKPTPGILAGMDFNKVSIDFSALPSPPFPVIGVQDFAAPPVGKALNYNERFREPSGRDVTGPDYRPTITGNIPVQLRYYDEAIIQSAADAAGVWPYSIPAIFLSDGSDGNAPELLANGRSVDQQIAFLQNPDNANKIFFGFGAQIDLAEDATVAFTTASLGHSITITNS